MGVDMGFPPGIGFQVCDTWRGDLLGRKMLSVCQVQKASYR